MCDFKHMHIYVCMYVISRSSCCLEGALGEIPALSVCVKGHNTVHVEDRCVAGASSALLISMPGMSVEARGPETGTSSYCGPIP